MGKRSFAAGTLTFILFGICSAQTKPNVLFIAIDDLNDWIGCLEGHSDAHTPNIDRLAGRGMLFTNAHCAAPACNPSRAAVFSGLLPAKAPTIPAIPLSIQGKLGHSPSTACPPIETRTNRMANPLTGVHSTFRTRSLVTLRSRPGLLRGSKPERKSPSFSR